MLFIGLSKNCMTRAESGYDYKKLMKISDIAGAQVSFFDKYEQDIYD